jgi:MFS family permease
MAAAADPPDPSTTPDSPAAASNESRESQPCDEEPPPTEEVEVYSLFNTPLHKLIIFTLLSLATLTSPLTATIYLPLLPLLSQHYAVSPQRINLTITIYIIFQALSPLLLSTPSDTLGRRPLFLLTFAIYTLASILLAIIRSSYAALLTLRALQSLGASAVLSVVYGTVSDVCVPSERGKVLGPVMAAANLGTAIGPIVGGWIALSSGSVWWVFWALAIFGAFMLVSLGALLPETARNVVGNGRIKDKAWNRPLLDLSRWSRSRTPACSTNRTTTDGGRPTRSLKFRNPLMSIRIMAHPDTAIILWIVGTFYALWYIVQASIPSVYGQHPYNFNEFQIGLAYLTGAVGVVICMYATGKAMDYNYRVIVRRMNFP